MAGFVVKVTAPDGSRNWISPPSVGGFPALGSREAADLFRTRADAHAAIDLMPYALVKAGVQFAIEPAR
jgi:hypothetical protein